MKGIQILSLVFAVSGAPAALRAEPLKSETISSETEEGGGPHLNANETSESVLAKAARMGVSVVIQSGGDDADGESFPPEPRPEIYTVKDGDTLWDISERFFGDAYVWPKIWSYNPNITNPNWIYPGDTLLLSPARKAPSDVSVRTASAPHSVEAMKASSMPKDALFMRSMGFVDKKALIKETGKIVGAHKEVLWLSQHDEAYVEFPEHTVRPGDRFAVFSVLRKVESAKGSDIEPGSLVEVKGFARVISFDAETKIARAMIEEAVRPIERGTLVGPVHQYWKTVSAVPNTRDVKGSIIAFLDPGSLAALQQVVFVDKGAEEGVTQGNQRRASENRRRARRQGRISRRGYCGDTGAGNSFPHLRLSGHRRDSRVGGGAESRDAKRILKGGSQSFHFPETLHKSAAYPAASSQARLDFKERLK